MSAFSPEPVIIYNNVSTKRLYYLHQITPQSDTIPPKLHSSEFQTPVLLGSSINTAGAEPSLDNAGNLYFTHHFIKDGKMIEADIYIAPRK